MCGEGTRRRGANKARRDDATLESAQRESERPLDTRVGCFCYAVTWCTDPLHYSYARNIHTGWYIYTCGVAGLA